MFPTAAAIAREAHKNPAPRVEGLVPVFDIMAHITYPGKSFEQSLSVEII